MDLKLELRNKLQLRLVPTARIQQALKLLQVPALELEQILKQEMMTNPLLEEIEEQEEELAQENPSEVESPSAETDGSESTAEEFDWESFLQEDFDHPRGEREAPSEDRMERVAPSKVSFQDHLHGQLRLAITDPEEYEIGAYIIGSLDDRGYLTSTDEEIAESLGVEPEDVVRVVKIVQGFDPVGVGARDLCESLLIQLRAVDMEDSLAARIVADHLEALKQKRYSEIARKTKSSLDDVREAAETISRLNPHPGFEYSVEAARPIIPDLIVDRVAEDYVVSLNDRAVPRLRVNQAYAGYLASEKGSGGKTREYIIEKLNSARWVIKAIEQRRRTMLRVMETIVEFQREFFDRGIEFLRPLTRQQIAERIGVHEATVSRATAGKYVQTPRGVFELKFFFSTGLPTDDGDEVSARRIKMRIAELVEKEDPRRPLSDQNVVDLLRKGGFRVARRTVAKYRDQMNILPARLRKAP